MILDGSVSTVDGDVRITGTAGNSGDGIRASSTATISAGGTGEVILMGTGGTGGGTGNNGVVLRNSTQVMAASGPITVTGIAGGGTAVLAFRSPVRPA